MEVKMRCECNTIYQEVLLDLKTRCCLRNGCEMRLGITYKVVITFTEAEAA